MQLLIRYCPYRLCMMSCITLRRARNMIAGWAKDIQRVEDHRDRERTFQLSRFEVLSCAMADGERTQVQEAKDELICCICTDLLSQPRSLKCLHTFCEECLNGLHRHQVTVPNTTADVLVCPECRSETELPPQGVTGRFTV